ncbi:MAG: helicase RepA family protein [Blastomonas sp.]|uniref:AAA family ATPase n=1 Tax=Blastomonas sp. TaxID=1909299 RepID=UPI003BD9AF27|nr:helicase RepA family protein [Blastomonas sp.]
MNWDEFPASPPPPRPAHIEATPFALPDALAIPRRAYLLGKWLQRGEISSIIAPGGTGKTTFEVALALSIATGRDIFNKGLHEGAARVWLWNLEDDRIELSRQLSAAASLHGLESNDLGDRLYVDGLDQSLCSAIETVNGAQLVMPVFDGVASEIERRSIDVLMIDPFVSSHAVNENDNGAIDAIVKTWKRVAQQTRCAIVLVHHTRKTSGQAVTSEDARGASALGSAARVVLTLNSMREEDGNRFGVADPIERRTIIRVDTGKINRAPPESAFWFKIHSVELANGDYVGAAARWNAPDPFESLSAADLYAVQMAIDAGDWLADAQAETWAGKAVANVLGLNVDHDPDKARIKSLIHTWTVSGALAKETRRCKIKGRDRPFLTVGRWINPADLPTAKGGVGNGG